MFFFNFLSKFMKKLKGKFLMCAKRAIKKFDPTEVVLPTKFISPGCPMVTSKSETLLYKHTPTPGVPDGEHAEHTTISAFRWRKICILFWLYPHFSTASTKVSFFLQFDCKA